MDGVRERVRERWEAWTAPSLWWLTSRWRRLRGRLGDYFADPERRVLASLVLLAAALRLAYLDLIPFGREQARYLVESLRVVSQGRLPLAGVEGAAGLTPPPLLTYLLALPVLLSRDPRLTVALVALLHVVALVDLYVLVRRHYGLRAALLTVGLFAVAPWPVLLSREVGPASWLLPLSIFWMHAAFVALVERKPWGWVAAFVLLAAMLYISFAALPLAALLALLILLYPRRVRWLEVLIGACLGAVLFLPYLYYENLHRFADLRLLAGEAVRSARELRWHLEGLRALVAAHSGQGLAAFMAPATEAFGLDESGLYRLSRLQGWLVALSVPTVTALGVLAWAHWREREDSYKYVLLGLWLWLPLLAPFLFAAPIAGASAAEARLTPEAMAVLFPAGFLALGLTLDRGLLLLERSIAGRRWWGPVLRLLLLALCLALVLWGAYQTVYVHGFVGEHDVAAGYGTPYRFWRRTANLVHREIRAAPTDQVWVYAQGSDPARDEQAMVLDYLLGPEAQAVFFRQVDNPAMFLPAARPGLYLLLTPSPWVEGTLRRLGAQTVGEVRFPDESLADLQLLEARPIDRMLEVLPERGMWALDAGLRLVGYDWPPNVLPGATVPLSTYWTMVDVPADVYESQHHLFAYLTDPSGNVLAESAGLGLDERYWQPGYLLKQWLIVTVPPDLPPGEYYILIGLERLSDGNLSLYVDEHGRPLGEAIPLGPLTIGQ